MKIYSCPQADLLNMNSTDIIATSLTVNDAFNGFGESDDDSWNWD